MYICQNRLKSPTEKGWLKSLLELVILLDELQGEGRGDSHRENAQQLLSVGDVRYCRLGAVEEAQEDAASVCSVAVNLLCCLLRQAAHHTLYPAYRTVGNKEDECDLFIPHNQKKRYHQISYCCTFFARVLVTKMKCD